MYLIFIRHTPPSKRCLLTHMLRFQRKHITSQEHHKIANIKAHGFTAQNLVTHAPFIFSLRRSGDSMLTFLTSCEMGGMTQENT